jgi:flagellar biogenesis protein FliO
MKKIHAARASVAAAVLSAAGAVLAAGEATGTEAVSEMQVSGSQFGMMVGALVVLGGVIWVIAKFVMK